jgi:hypothetical protein
MLRIVPTVNLVYHRYRRCPVYVSIFASLHRSVPIECIIGQDRSPFVYLHHRVDSSIEAIDWAFDSRASVLNRSSRLLICALRISSE